MWEVYRNSLPKYQKISLSEERRLIARAKKGSDKCADEIVLRHVCFVIFRLQKVAFPEYLKRFGEDMLSEATLVLRQKIKTYNLRYRDKNGCFKPVRFASYIWKRIDGLVIDSIAREIKKEKTEVSGDAPDSGCYWDTITASPNN